MADVVIQSFSVPSYAGMLFNKGNTATPFSTAIGGRARNTSSKEFVTGQSYTTASGSQPAISGEASLTAPYSTAITRTQLKNVTQIFQESVYMSYEKLSNYGNISGLNIAGQTANPINELDFQIAAKMTKVGQDAEYTFLNGVYNVATTDATINKTRGMFPAITTNVLDLAGAGLRVWDIAEAMKLISDSNGSTDGLALWCDATTLFQLNADAEANGLTVVPASREVNGLALSQIITPLGVINIYMGKYVPSATAGIFNLNVVSPVYQPVPGKGNFFLEELAKTGAGTKYQIYGELGLDHGPEWYHAKITGISTEFVKPAAGKHVYVSNAAVATADVLPVLDTVTLSGTPTVSSATDALAITYIGTPTTAATLAYQWKIGASATGTFANISGATSATYSPVVGDVDKYIKCQVTATGTAAGVVLSNAKKVVAAG